MPNYYAYDMALTNGNSMLANGTLPQKIIIIRVDNITPQDSKLENAINTFISQFYTDTIGGTLNLRDNYGRVDIIASYSTDMEEDIEDIIITDNDYIVTELIPEKWNNNYHKFTYLEEVIHAIDYV